MNHLNIIAGLRRGMYTDSTGSDLEEFIRSTLNKTQKDRMMLMKLESDLTNFIKGNE